MTTHAIKQGRAQLASIVELKQRYDAAQGDDQALAQIEDEIYLDPLEVSVRSGWVQPNTETFEADEFRILLCTGGPAVQIVGRIDDYGGCQLQVQDWFEPWAPIPLTDDEQEAVNWYAAMFFPC